MMKYVSPVCEMVKFETEDIMETSLGNIAAGVTFSGATNAVDKNNTSVTEHDDGTKDVSVGIDFSKLNTTNG